MTDLTALSETRLDLTTARLYALLPAHIRDRDTAEGGALHALMAVLGSGSAEIDAEIDWFYDALFVETAPATALDQIAALVGSEPLRPLPAGAAQTARAFIANTLRYRRGKGTARVIETLAADVTGYGAVVVEYFMRLSRLPDLLDLRTDRPALALLVPGQTAARAGIGFDLLPRLADLRSIAAVRAAGGIPSGRHWVSNVGVHLTRPVVPTFPAPAATGSVSAVDVAGVPMARPWPVGGAAPVGYFQMAAQSGRPLRLFNPNRRSAARGDRMIDVDLPDRLRRLPLHLETRELRRAMMEGRAARLPDRPWFDPTGLPFAIYLRRGGDPAFTRVPPEQVLIVNFDLPPVPVGARPAATEAHHWVDPATPAPVPRNATHPIACAFDPVTGRLVTAPGNPPGTSEVDQVRIAYGTGIGQAIGAGQQDRNTADQPFEIRDSDGLTHLIRLVDAAQMATGATGDTVRRVPTLAVALADHAVHGAGRRTLIVLTRCDRDTGGPINVPLHPQSDLTIVAADWRDPVTAPGLTPDTDLRGYLVRRDRRFTIDAAVTLTALNPVVGQAPGRLVLDGLELTRGLIVGAEALSRIEIRSCTIRNPGAAAFACLGPLTAANLTIEATIMGCIRMVGGAAIVTGALLITRSILSSDGVVGDAVTAPDLDATLCNVTILGPSRFRSLEGTNVIFTDPVTVTRSQSGCLRYSFVPPGSVTPRHFRCQPDLAFAAVAMVKGAPLTQPEKRHLAQATAPLFLDTSLDEPTVAMFHPRCPDAIRAGGEGDTEMGAFSDMAEALRRANLTSLFDDYVPFGLTAGLVDDTRSTATTLQRNRP